MISARHQAGAGACLVAGLLSMTACGPIRYLPVTGDGTRLTPPPSTFADDPYPALDLHPAGNATAEDWAQAIDDPSAAVALGLTHSNRLHAAHARWRAAMLQIPQARTLPDPMLGFGWFIEPVHTRNGPQRTTWRLSQVFPWFGTLAARGDVVARMAEERWWELQALRLALVEEITVAWWDLAWTGRQATLLDKHLDLLRGFEPTVQQAIRGGRPQADLIRLQLEIGQLEDRRTRLADRRPPLAARLAAIIGLDEATATTWPQWPDGALSAVTTEDAGDLAADNPELRGLLARATRETERLRLADKAGLPHLELGVNAITVDGGKDPLAVTLGFSLPIWRDSYAAAAEEARQEHAAAMSEREDRRQRLEAILALARFDARDARRRLVLYDDSLLPRAQQAVAVSLAAYRATQGNLTDLIDSQRAELELADSRDRSRRDLAVALAAIARLTGATP